MNNIDNRIGFIQGRLSDMVDGKIQAFPWDSWKDEFVSAAKLDIHLMEWTLDQDNLYENPLITESGQEEILALMDKYDVRIKSLTGDCFMQAPYWKEKGINRESLLEDFRRIISACSFLGIQYIVVPLVDNGSVENKEQKESLFLGLKTLEEQLRESNIKVLFESDYPPSSLVTFMNELDKELFAINYDIGNSAALGFNPVDEIREYGKRIWNVHVKDRVLKGTTVPLGEGDADFETVFSELKKSGYNGNYILQTARADDNNHAEVLNKYRNMVVDWMAKS